MNRKPFLQKLIVCFLAGIIGAYAISELGRKIFAQWLPIVSGISGIFFLSTILYAFVWHYKEKKHNIDSLRITAFWDSVIGYFISIDLSMFAMRKIFHLQLYAPTALLDKPFSHMTGEQLSDAFFGYSYTYVLCIAGLQIAGAVLLLFKRTRLAAIFILLPVIFNIILTDIFYDVEIGALLQATALLLGLFYLLSYEFTRLADFFFRTKNNFLSFSFRSSAVKNMIRSSVIIIPFIIAILLYDLPNRHPEITGKYQVTKLVVNNNTITAHSCTDSVLTLVYIDDNSDLVFEYNSQKRWQVGHFKFDKQTKQLKAVWRYPKGFHDTLFATLSNKGHANEITLTGTMGKDALTVDLLKVK